jgi:choice-of-anchor A domain-containing protein
MTWRRPGTPWRGCCAPSSGAIEKEPMKASDVKMKKPFLQPSLHQAAPARRRLLACLTAAVCLHTAQAQEIDLGTAARYAGFILGSASGMVRVEGRLAVAHDLDSDQLEVASAQPEEPDEQASLVVGGAVRTYRRGDIWRSGGRKGYGAYGGDKGDTASTLDLRHEDSPVDFDAETVWLTMLSADLDQRKSGAVLTFLRTVTLIGSNADLEVFRVSAALVAKDKTLLLKNIKSGARIVINVDSDQQRQVSLAWNQDVLKTRRTRVLFHFADAEVLRFDGARVWGSILAPHACIQGSDGRVDGNVVAASWKSGAEIGYAPFEAGP